MTYQHLHALSKHPKLRNYLKKGVCIAERMILNTPVLLFQLSNQYLEVFFTADGNDVVSTRSFSEVEELEPYLNQIDIHTLLSV